MKSERNLILQSPTGRPVLVDYFYNEDGKGKPVVIFCHGFKGFKDWGHFNNMAEKFAEKGFLFIKFNFSHNGTTIDLPNEFHDLNAFSLNNFSKELDDLGIVMDFAENEFIKKNIAANKIYLIGHSRGGGIAILKAAEDQRVKKVVAWASVSDFEKVVNPKNLEEWREKGIIYIENVRTKQQMPVDFQLHEDYYANEERLNIKSAIKNINVPLLIIHGGKDDVVKAENAERLKHWQENAELIILEDENHTFGASHPFTPPLPSGVERAIAETIKFLVK